jgi:hypothetical protein
LALPAAKERRWEPHQALPLTNVATVINTLKGFDKEAQAAVICTKHERHE